MLEFLSPNLKLLMGNIIQKANYLSDTSIKNKPKINLQHKHGDKIQFCESN